ncbi:class I SAM-dependent methyltransferase [Pelagibius sp. 7325]|uniref:class I SAM-dependent methyltransferase n=1 Tax=Pelagibius sp. 7325 TaxID=3131994 RepID=UPI0030EEC062
MTDSQLDYADYLKQRSWKGLLYRRYVLYPRLCRQLTGHVLDIGCGIGDMLAFRPDTEGVDVNPHTVALCRKRGLHAREMAPDRLPYADAAFDGAMMDNVLEHIAEPGPILGEVRRVLAPSGTFVCGVPGRRGFAADPDHKVFYDEGALRRTVETYGFTTRTVFHMPFRSSWLEARMSQYCVYGVFERA